MAAFAIKNADSQIERLGGVSAQRRGGCLQTDD